MKTLHTTFYDYNDLHNEEKNIIVTYNYDVLDETIEIIDITHNNYSILSMLKANHYTIERIEKEIYENEDNEDNNNLLDYFFDREYNWNN